MTTSRLFSEWEAYEELDRRGDPLEQIKQLVDFERFRPILEECWRHEAADPSQGGRPAYDVVMMFKVLLIGRKGNLSCERMSHAVVDSRSVTRFLDVAPGEPVPSRQTIARYRDALDEHTMRELFEDFEAQLRERGYVARGGQVVDSTLVLVPVQRNTREENRALQRNETPDTWKEDEATAKLRQKDRHARWTKKHGKSSYGYKNHVNVDVEHKLIRGYVATPANDHDITVVDALIDGRQREGPFYGDAAYRSQEVEGMLRAQGLTSRIMFKRGKHRALTAYQHRENRRRAKVRVRVEHVFASCQNELGGKFIRTIGLDRASVQMGLQNLLYNKHRLVFLAREAMV